MHTSEQSGGLSVAPPAEQAFLGTVVKNMPRIYAQSSGVPIKFTQKEECDYMD